MPSTSAVVRPASASASSVAAVASDSSDTPESLLNSVAPIPAIAHLSRWPYVGVVMSSLSCRSLPVCATLLGVPLRDAPHIGTAGPVTEQGGDGPRRVRKTSEVVAMQIVKDIVDRGLVEGDRLPLEAAMVRQYRVSRASLREA